MSDGVSDRVWDIGDSVLEIREQSTVSASNALVDAVDSGSWKALKLKVRKKPGEDHWTIDSGDFTGVAQLNVAGTNVDLRVVPKISGLDLFFLADRAFGENHAGHKIPKSRANLSALREEPAACLLAWYVSEVDRFATRWLRRGYTIREEELIGRVRGKVDLGRFYTRSVPLGRPHAIPSRFSEPSQDTPENRYLKAGLRHVYSLARTLPLKAARTELQKHIRHTLRLFSSVGDSSVRAQDARRFNLRGPLKHYSPVIQLTRALLEGSFVEFDFGCHTQDAIMWSLNRLYEDALRNVLRGLPRARLLDDKYSATVSRNYSSASNGRTPVTPDYVIQRADGAKVVLDAKYKDVAPHRKKDDESTDFFVSGAGRIRVRRADVYQAVAYAHHVKLETDRVALLYPVALPEGVEYPWPFQVNEFSPRCAIIFFDVGPNASANVANLYHVLSIM